MLEFIKLLKTCLLRMSLNGKVNSIVKFRKMNPTFHFEGKRLLIVKGF